MNQEFPGQARLMLLVQCQIWSILRILNYRSVDWNELGWVSTSIHVGWGEWRVVWSVAFMHFFASKIFGFLSFLGVQRGFATPQSLQNVALILDRLHLDFLIRRWRAIVLDNAQNRDSHLGRDRSRCFHNLKYPTKLCPRAREAIATVSRTKPSGSATSRLHALEIRRSTVSDPCQPEMMVCCRGYLRRGRAALDQYHWLEEIRPLLVDEITYCTSTGHTWKTPRGFRQIQWLTYTKPGEEKEKLNRRCRLTGGPDWSANFDRAKRTIISFCMFVAKVWRYRACRAQSRRWARVPDSLAPLSKHRWSIENASREIPLPLKKPTLWTIPSS